MKKVLMIVLTLCMLQIIVLAAVITVGNEATDENQQWNVTYTIVDIHNPADGTGTITSIEIYAKEFDDLVNCEVATFFVVAGTNLSTRDTVTIGAVTGGSKQTFTEDSGSDPIALEVEAGDYIGLYATDGTLERKDDGGQDDSCYYRTPASDQIPCTNITFTLYDGLISLKGTGVTEEEAAIINVINMGTNF